MHLGVNATFRLHGGGLTHLRQLLRSWAASDVSDAHQVTLLTRKENVTQLEDVLGEWVQVQIVDRRPFNLLTKLRWEQTVLPKVLAQNGIDVLFCPGNMVPLRCPVPAVVLFQNAAPFCSGMSRSTVGTYNWLWFRALGAMMKRSARVARRSIFVSHHLKELFVQRFGLPPERADVIYHGTDEEMAANDPQAEPEAGRTFTKPYVLSVSHLYPYKKTRELILGFDLARAEMEARGLQLVLVGEERGKRHFAELTSLVRERDLGHLVQFAGGVPHETVTSALRSCDFFVFQSTCENCPITLIEALEAGVPICCSNVGVMPEIAGDAALYFDPVSPTSIAEALVRMAAETDLRREMSQKASVQAGKFPTWQEVGARTLAVLEKAVQGR